MTRISAEYGSVIIRWTDDKQGQEKLTLLQDLLFSLGRSFAEKTPDDMESRSAAKSVPAASCGVDRPET